MTRTKLGLLGFCAMLFGLMAFSASGAQAAGQWLFAEAEGTNLINFLEAEVELEKEVGNDGESHYVLHSEILKIKYLVLCSTIKADAKLISEGRIGTNGEPKGAVVLFSGCKVFLNGTEAPECNTVGGNITTLPGHAVLQKHTLGGGTVDDVLIVLPDAEAAEPVFANIESTSSCPVGQKIPVIGKLALQDCKGLGLVHSVKHLVEVFEPLTTLATISLTVEHKATILGSAWAFLKGAHIGIKFSGDPA
jgi:hypothetical protein